MSRVRRFVVLSSEETHALQGVLRNKRGRRIEVVRHIRLSDNASREDLAPLLSLEALSRDGVSGILIANGDYARLAPGLISHFQNSGIEVLSERSFREKEAGSIDINQHDEKLISLDDVFQKSWIAIEPYRTIQRTRTESPAQQRASDAGKNTLNCEKQLNPQ